jgi:hypothetical protein
LICCFCLCVLVADYHCCCCCNTITAAFNCLLVGTCCDVHGSCAFARFPFLPSPPVHTPTESLHEINIGGVVGGCYLEMCYLLCWISCEKGIENNIFVLQST